MDGQDEYDFLFKIVIIGESGVGKSNILTRYISNTFQLDHASTIGVEFSLKDIKIKHKEQTYRVKSQIWDTAGQERYRSLAVSFFRGAVGALVVYDISQDATFEKVEEWIQQIKNQAKGVQIILVGNKCDLENMRKVSKGQGQNLAEQMGLLFIETSAMTGENIDKAFIELIKQVIDIKNKADSMEDEGFKPQLVIHKEEVQEKEKQGCC
ncbi:Rab11 [Hexamita inflata]|uniref:Rab11 n=1 Tax=Hexamita inflata TaxID=28002 RepID=A0AA86NTF2_9EUKA|nr:Rab11 [Hexamita inflata]CAI9971796.1 Rab11 [Hexamita inflata]